ncbi:MAG TPA: DUF1573 domain-containing protein [Thermoanaerobaculia bacterium]|nr:DUF1573 domain-containing protein [Thermoanaerobaculia bacterium]
MVRSPRALWGALAVLLAFSAGAAETPAPAAESPRPKMVVVEMVADLGEVSRGTTATHDFIIRNEGDATLEIKEVKPTCGCTVARFDRTIPPGGTGTIHAELDTTNIAGSESKPISVITNDPDRPHVQLSLLVKVVQFTVFNPGFSRFVKGQGHPPGVVTQIFYSVSFDDLTIEKVESPYPFLRVDYRPATPEESWKAAKGKQWVLTLTLDYDAAPVGSINSNVKVYSNHPKQKVSLLPVSGFVRPRMAVTPPVGDFGELTYSDGAVGNFFVQNFAEKPLKVTGATSTLEGAEIKLETIEEGKKYNVTFALPDGMAKGEFKAEVHIATDSPQQPVVIVPVKGKVL